MKNFSVILITSLAQNLFANGFTTLSPGVLLLKRTALVDGINTCKRNTARIGRSTKVTTLKESIATGLEESFSSTEEERKKRIVVVGGGWAGYSFCESISQNDDVEIILLDASKQARGGLAGGYRDSSSNNRPVEAGIHGFWREYRNTFDIMSAIEGVDVDDVLSDFTPSALYSKDGKVALAPVLLEDENDNVEPAALKDLSVNSIRRFLAANLPPPLDLPILAELDQTDSKLTPIDLLSGLGLLGAWADFEQESSASWKNYDSQPASLLFKKAGITDALYEELVSPLLHVLPMCPAYDCSAAAALSCFHVFALQSRGAFDVRWCRGSIAELIFAPWEKQLRDRGVVVRGGARVESIVQTDMAMIDVVEEKVGTHKYTVTLSDDTIECDAVVLAVGATSMAKIASSSPAIASLPASKDFDKLRGVTCVAVRLFLKTHETITSDLEGGLHDKTQLPPDIAKAMSDSPIAVCGAGIGGIDELKETGFCIYDLQRMHDEFSVDNGITQDEREQVAVLEVDFYRADAIANLDNENVADLALEAVAAALGTTKIDPSNIIDSTVLRARNAVSHFAPKSALYSPSVKLDEGLYVCGDYVDRMGHASWSTEKSVVTARQAASIVSKDFGFENSRHDVIPAAKDTPQLSTLRKSTKLLRAVLPPKDVPSSPWVFAKQVLAGKKQN